MDAGRKVKRPAGSMGRKTGGGGENPDIGLASKTEILVSGRSLSSRCEQNRNKKKGGPQNPKDRRVAPYSPIRMDARRPSQQRGREKRRTRDLKPNTVDIGGQQRGGGPQELH